MKAMVLFSGGIDSTTCLGMAVEKYGPENVIALSISYGQKHTKEIEASDKIVKYYNVEHIYLDLAKIFQYSDCSLLSHSDKEIPKESYDEQIKSTNGSPVSTYVPHDSCTVLPDPDTLRNPGRFYKKPSYPLLSFNHI